jgi:rifampicin phosphotransferase
MSQPTTGRFRTEWDTTPNPTYDIWTITNGGEVVPGVLRPFVASSFNRQDYESLVKLMGAYPTGHLVDVHKPPVGNFFGIVAGRIALNVGFTAAAMSVLDPEIAEAMLQQFFTGAGGTDRFIVRVPDEERAPAVAIAEAQRAAAPAQLAARQQALYAERGSAQPAADRALSLKQAWERHQVLTAEAVDGVNIHYVVSTAAGEWQVKLAGLLMMCGQDPAAVIALCSGLGEVESAKPAIALYDLAMTAARSETVATALNTQPAATVLESIRVAQSGAGQSGDASPAHDNDEWRAFADRFQEFLHLYGFRVQGEVDVSNADWSEQPTFVISQIRSMMAVPEGDSPRAQVAKAAAGREALEATIRGAIGPDMVPTFDAVLAQAQHFTRLRELSKATWVLDVRRGRSTYLALCDGISAVLGITPDDVNFLLIDEVAEVATTGVLADASSRIARRKAEWDEAHHYVLPDVWVGEPTIEPLGAVPNVTELTGLAVSAGNGLPVRGTARIVPDVQAAMEREIEVGDILIAPFTDAPWTPLFIPAGAVVVETGGVLSHAATVAREFGIPCVVMVKDATRVIHDGDTVEVNGVTGQITIVTRA